MSLLDDEDWKDIDKQASLNLNEETLRKVTERIEQEFTKMSPGVTTYTSGIKPSDLNDEDWEQVKIAAEKVRNRFVEDALFGTRLPYSSTAESGARRPFNTGRMASSFGFRRPMFTPSIPIIITPFLTETVKSYRKRKWRFWEKVLRWFWEPVSFFPYTLVELYEEKVPAIAWLNGKIYCHPALADVVRKVIKEYK